MKVKIPWEVWNRKGKELLGRYKYVLLMILVGLLFLLWPAGNEKSGEDISRESSLVAAERFSVSEMERRLSETLSKIHGAGEVTVMLTVQGDFRQILAKDEVSVMEADGSSKVERKVVTINGSGGEETVVLQRMNPVYQGAVVVCEGGDSGKVKLKLMEAVAALTGLGTDKITICKGKG